jgi:hypothetical protein
MVGCKPSKPIQTGTVGDFLLRLKAGLGDAGGR